MKPQCPRDSAATSTINLCRHNNNRQWLPHTKTPLPLRGEIESASTTLELSVISSMRVNAFIKVMLQWSTTPCELFMLGSAAGHWKGVQDILPNSGWA